MTDVTRDEQIELWWENVSSWLGLQAEEARLFQSFRQVLRVIPADMFRPLLEVDPVVMCPGLSAFVVDCPSPPFRECSRPLMYFTPTIPRMTNQHLIDRVAHEIAHGLLGHYQPDVSLRLPPHTCEAEADQLSQQRGFRPRSTRAELRRLQQDWCGESQVEEPPAP
jgi:hypothetical protein